MTLSREQAMKHSLTFAKKSCPFCCLSGNQKKCIHNLLYTKLNCRLHQLLTGPEPNLYFASQNTISDILFSMKFYDKVHNTA